MGFGSFAALSGDTLAVGYSDDPLSGQLGAVLVFSRNAGVWTPDDVLPTAGLSSPTDRFPRSLATDGDVVLVGTEVDDLGEIRVFRRNGTAWVLETSFASDDVAKHDAFGYSVDLDGDRAIVGAPAAVTLGSPVGAAYVFSRSGTTWSQEARIGSGAGWIGGAVAIDGDTAVVGAPAQNAPFPVPGRASVYVRSGTTWASQALLDGTMQADSFGASVDVEGDVVLVGAPRDSTAFPFSGEGAGYAYRRHGTDWSPTGKLVQPGAQPDDELGRAVALTAEYAWLGAEGDDPVGAESGSLQAFHWSGSAWRHDAELTGSGAEPGGQMGTAVAADGNSVVCTATSEGSGLGAAYVFLVAPPPSTYCTAGTTASGCQAALSASGTPSASASSGFVVSVQSVEGLKDGILFFSTSGPQASPWGNGSSYLCVLPPLHRTGLQPGVGTAGSCDGTFALDFNAWMVAHPSGAPPEGAEAAMQCWFRDPMNTSNQTTSLSDALSFTICP